MENPSLALIIEKHPLALINGEPPLTRLIENPPVTLINGEPPCNSN